MGLATIDPDSLTEHTEIHKIPKFGVYQERFLLRYSDLNTSKFTKKCMATDSVQMAIHFFVNFDIIFLTIGSIYTKLGDL